MSDQMLSNPDLLLPGQDPSKPAVPAMATITQALPSTPTDTIKWYICTVNNASFHRTDGKKLAFLFNILPTDDKYDQEYLDKEIDYRNPYVRYATTEEIQIYKMRTNPREVIEAEVRADIEAEVRKEYEDKITELQRTQGVDPVSTAVPVDVGGAKLTPASTANLAEMLSSTSTSK